MLAKGVVHLEALVLYKLSYTINSVFAFMDNDRRVSAWHTINLAIYQFLLEKWPFADTYVLLK